MIRQAFTFFVLLLSFCVLLSVGCNDGGRAKPKDLPPLYSATLTFTQEGIPLDDASIVLHSDGKWAVAGRTNESGEVKLTTNGYYDGVPAGTYKISVTKVIFEQNSKGLIVKQTDVIPNQFKTENTTPLEIEIRTKDNNKTFDLGKAIKVNVPIEP